MMFVMGFVLGRCCPLLDHLGMMTKLSEVVRELGDDVSNRGCCWG